MQKPRYNPREDGIREGLLEDLLKAERVYIQELKEQQDIFSQIKKDCKARQEKRKLHKTLNTTLGVDSFALYFTPLAPIGLVGTAVSTVSGFIIEAIDWCGNNQLLGRIKSSADSARGAREHLVRLHEELKGVAVKLMEKYGLGHEIARRLELKLSMRAILPTQVVANEANEIDSDVNTLKFMLNWCGESWDSASVWFGKYPVPCSSTKSASMYAGYNFTEKAAKKAAEEAAKKVGTKTGKEIVEETTKQITKT